MAQVGGEKGPKDWNFLEVQLNAAIGMNPLRTDFWCLDADLI
jgi:hypothetical protein